MYLSDVSLRKHYQNFIETLPISTEYDVIFDYICKNINIQNISYEEIEYLFAEYNNNINYIRIFNVMFPCYYIPDNKKIYIAMIIMLKFKEYENEE